MSETVTQADAGTPGGIAKVDDVEEAMRDVVDPELGINVVDLGLVYGIHVDADNACTLDMTHLGGLPADDVIEDQTNSALSGLVGRQDQLGLDAAVGPGQDHRRGSRAAAGPRLQHPERVLPRNLDRCCRTNAGGQTSCSSRPMALRRTKSVGPIHCRQSGQIASVSTCQEASITSSRSRLGSGC